MGQQSRRLAPGQSLEATKAAANDPPSLPTRNRGPREERLRGLRRLEASGSTEDEMRRYANEFVITDPDKQANLDQWRDDPWGYARDTISNVPGNAWEMVWGIPALGKLVVDAPAEAAVRGIGTIADLLGKTAPVSHYSRGESLEAVAGMPRAIWDDLVSSYSTPEGFATHVKENPLGVVGDVSAGFGTVLKTPTIARGLNALSKRPVVAGSLAGLGTFTVTQDFTNSWKAAISAYGMAKARKFFDAKMDEMELGKVTRADKLTKAQLKQTWDDAVEQSNIMTQQQARLASEAATATKDIRIHQANIDRIDKASSVTAMESAELKARFHARHATGMGESERATILSAVEESVTNRRAVLAREEAARESAAASRQQMADARVTANVTERQNTRVASESADEAARIRESARERAAASRQQMAEGRESARIMDQGQDRVARESDAASRQQMDDASVTSDLTNRRNARVTRESAAANRQQMEDASVTSDLTNRRNDRVAGERADDAARVREDALFPEGRESLPPTATETSSRLNDGMRRSVSQRFQQPSVEPPMTASHVSSSNPARAALDEMIETKVTPLESNAGSVPITRVTGAEGAMIAKTITDIKSGARRILTTEEMKYPEIREAWELAQARRHGMTHAARPAPATSAEREAIIQIEAGKNRVGRR